MEKLLLNTYVHSLWDMFIQNNIALGISVVYDLEEILVEFWQNNIDANVPAKDLSAATLDNLYQLVMSQSEDALNTVKALW